MRKLLAATVAVGLLATSAQAQVHVRYFLSLVGLSNPAEIDGGVNPPPIGADPFVDAGGDANAVTRLYLWADLSASPVPTDRRVQGGAGSRR